MQIEQIPAWILSLSGGNCFGPHFYVEKSRLLVVLMHFSQCLLFLSDCWYWWSHFRWEVSRCNHRVPWKNLVEEVQFRPALICVSFTSLCATQLDHDGLRGNPKTDSKESSYLIFVKSSFYLYINYLSTSLI